MQQPLPWTISPWPHNLSQQASGNPGAVQCHDLIIARRGLKERIRKIRLDLLVLVLERVKVRLN